MTEHVDARLRTLARESRHIVAFGLSGTTSRAAVLIPGVLVISVHVRARQSRSARVKGFCVLGFFEIWHRSTARKPAGAMQREECDDGIDLVRRSRRAAEETLGGRTFGEPDRRRARKCDAECRDRQGAPAGSFRPRQEPLLGGAAAAEGAPRPAHDAGLASGVARQHRAGACLRSRAGARSDRLRQCGADQPAAVALGTERGDLPLAGRRSVEPGFLLLRRQGAGEPALLRASLARRLPARRRPPAPAAEADEVDVPRRSPQQNLSSPGLIGRPSIPETFEITREAAAYWIARSSRAMTVFVVATAPYRL